MYMYEYVQINMYKLYSILHTKYVYQYISHTENTHSKYYINTYILVRSTHVAPPITDKANMSLVALLQIPTMWLAVGRQTRQHNAHDQRACHRPLISEDRACPAEIKT